MPAPELRQETFDAIVDLTITANDVNISVHIS